MSKPTHGGSGHGLFRLHRLPLAQSCNVSAALIRVGVQAGRSWDFSAKLLVLQSESIFVGYQSPILSFLVPQFFMRNPGYIGSSMLLEVCLHRGQS